MAEQEPVGELDARYSTEGAAATEWAQVRDILQEAEVFWITTVRPDSRPHVTPLLAIWLDDALHFCTGVEERKAINLQGNPHCVLTTGCNTFSEGFDLVVEGDAVQVGDDAALHRLADAYEAKYGSGWRFAVRDGLFHNDGGPAVVYRVAPAAIFGFGKGRFSQTHWRFEQN